MEPPADGSLGNGGAEGTGEAEGSKTVMGKKEIWFWDDYLWSWRLRRVRLSSVASALPRRLSGVISHGPFSTTDDGKLSLDEFQSYFTDGILTEEQMQELYYSIDRQRTK